MDFNDYIQIGGSLNKIVSLKGIVREISSGIEQQDDLKSCHIPITGEVLIACGFIKNEKGQYYTDLQEGNHRYRISRIYLPPSQEYELLQIDTSKDPLKKDIAVLSELQDWVRVNTGMELIVDENKLAEAVKNFFHK